MMSPASAAGTPCAWALGADAIPSSVAAHLLAQPGPVSGYVYDVAVATAQARRLRAALPSWARLLFAVKSNGYAPVLRALLAKGGAGLVLESARGECAPGQYEIVFRYDEALPAADQAAFFKTGVKQMAAQEGMAATFLPKYDAGEGSSCHFHVSLRDVDGRPVFPGAGPHGMSELLRHALAGQMALLPELTLLFAPTVNAFKRLRPGAFAPVHAAWGPDNRLTALRLAGSGASLRVEHRVPGADADPYLALAGILLAFRHGIEERLELPPATIGAPAPDAVALPEGLHAAADLLEHSMVARKGLGDAVVDALVASARAEWTAYCSIVSEWERARGFERR